MAQALSDLYNSLNSAGYDSQRQAINGQLGSIDGQTQAQIGGLDAQKNIAFNGINNQANSNGMFYSGAPTAQEQQYTAASYMPALANLQTQASNQKYGLQQALAGVTQNQTSAAQGIYQNQVQNDQQNNYYNQQLAQQKAYNDSMANMYRGGGSSGGGTASNPYSMSSDASGGLQFSYGGKPITAQQYATANGTSVAALLGQSKNKGDQQLLQQYQSGNAQQRAQLAQKYNYIFGG